MTPFQMVAKPRPKRPKKPKSPYLEKNSAAKAVVLKVFTRSPKKPNSANRRCCRVQTISEPRRPISDPKQFTAFIPGIGHNLQEHSVVMVRGGKTGDLPTVNYKVIRGVLDCAGVVGRITSRSKYGAKRPKAEEDDD